MHLKILEFLCQFIRSFCLGKHQTNNLGNCKSMICLMKLKWSTAFSVHGSVPWGWNWTQLPQRVQKRHAVGIFYHHNGPWSIRLLKVHVCCCSCCSCCRRCHCCHRVAVVVSLSLSLMKTLHVLCKIEQVLLPSRQWQIHSLTPIIWQREGIKYQGPPEAEGAVSVGFASP